MDPKNETKPEGTVADITTTTVKKVPVIIELSSPQLEAGVGGQAATFTPARCPPHAPVY